jgi:hypothetical protein
VSSATARHVAVSDWPAFPVYDICFTDPPWNAGIMRRFQRLAVEQGGSTSNDTLGQALGSLFRKAWVNRPLFVAYGMTAKALPMRLARENGHRLDAVSVCVQTNGKPFVILNFNTPRYTVPDGLRGYETIAHAVRAFVTPVVFDPFAGIGRSAAAVLGAGGSYIGGEMNAARYRKLEDVCRAHCQ